MVRLLTVVATFACFLSAARVSAAANDWKPIDPAHLALPHPKIQPGADAEALLWEVRVSDALNGRGDATTTFQHYLRVKIFTDRGREKFATVDIPYLSGVKVEGVAARTIRPDGSILELKQSDTYRRTLVKTNDVKVQVVSFALPGIDRGMIVEYRWREVHADSVAMNLRLQFSREIPVHDVRYYVRPVSVPGYGMIAWPYHGQFAPPEKQSDGYTVLRLSNVAANSTEEYAVPPFEQRPWVFVSYEPRGSSSSEEAFWRRLAKDLFEDGSKRARPDEAIRILAAKATAGSTTVPDKLAALVRAARSSIRRVDTDTAAPEDARKAAKAKDASAALKRGVGTADDVLLVLLALSNAAGLDARLAATSSRADLFDRSVRPHPYFVRGRIVAVRNGDGWLFADPTNEYADRGELPWEYEGQRVLVADRQAAVFAQTPNSATGYSVKKRTGRFRLLEDGTLEGDARIEYTGHWGDVFREQEDQDAPAEREKTLRELVTSRLAGAEISDIRIEHVADAAGPYTNAFRLRVPGFAQRVGSRLMLQPFLFQKGLEAVFTSTERKSPVYFPFAWSEEDDITIELPPAFSGEAWTPKKVDVGAASYELRVQVDGGKATIRRSLHVGTGGLFYDVAAYRPLRVFFDALHRADAHTVVLQGQGGRP